jgi:hypothetical protein
MTENPTNNKKDIRKNYVDSALGTAIYILKSIDEGQSKKEIIQSLVLNDGKSRILQYEIAISSKVQDANNISQQHELDKYQQEMIDFYHAAFAKIMETTLMDYWNYFWSQTLPITNRITEIYAAALNRLVNDTKTASKTANEVIFANIEVFNAAYLK